MDFITRAVVSAVQHLYQVTITEADVNLQETRKEFEGQVTVVTFPITRLSRKSPEQTGQDIGAYLQEQVAEISAFNVVKGFLNISIADSYWQGKLINEVMQPEYTLLPQNGQRVMVEYSSPNTNKPLHLGHVRNNLLGYSIAEILAASGYEVIKANLVNDRGIHICKSMLAWQKWGNGETPQSAGLKGDKLVGNYYVLFDKEYKKQIEDLKAQGQTEEEAKKNAPLTQEAQQMLQDWEAGKPEVIELWSKMNGWVYEGFESTYKKLGVNFDKYYYESNTYLLGKDIIEEGLANGVFFKKEDGSVWIDLTADGLDQKLVLRADGTSVYITQDLGTAQLKYNDYKMDESVYVVGNEQDYHFKVLFLILQKLGKSWAKGLYHLSYGMVDLPSGKMKSREGTVVDADDLIADMERAAQEQAESLGKIEDFTDAEKQHLYHIIGMGALKFFLLKVEPKKRLLFNPNESIELQGHTGPFIQYTHARIKSLFRKAGIDFSKASIEPVTLSSTERDLIVLLTQYSKTIKQAAADFSPAIVANYSYELAKSYNKFYQENSVLQAGDENTKLFRLKLSSATASLIAQSMKLLGIEVPEQM
ncbi:arginine--tRNA ligase [Mucilaginibacter koreensis]